MFLRSSDLDFWGSDGKLGFSKSKKTKRKRRKGSFFKILKFQFLMEDFQEENFSPHSSLSSFSSPNQDLLLMDAELWLMSEQRTQEILCTVQPNIMCDKRRKEVINYLRSLIIGYFGTEVLAFGSVPLKTYLPDGDIDITAFSHQHLVEDFAGEVCSILEREGDSEFQVKDVQYINAQVFLSWL
ncbi:hypothetical protein L484_011228 [Morus notabilis]|uniref:Polymerase nucleotidyl transferase domain-containing protein n=1 Tax=Morus notabilis TaxID=981085 RepID=W9RLC4_9ROSA|nr:hypothetical protein L484_011228 [Morus notabilis]